MNADDADDIDLPDDWQYDLTPPQWHQDVCAALEYHLNEARRGQIVGVAIIGVHRTEGGHSVGTGYLRGDAPISALMAGAQYLLARLVAHTE